jgi:two-component system, NtrC family, nitrogen regulation sensor histidine kinase NtrY
VTGSTRRGLRSRLLAAFAIVAVPPLLAFAAIVMAVVSERLERSATQRLDSGLQAVQRRLAERRRAATERVTAAAAEDLRAVTDEGRLREAATAIARRRELDVVEIVGRDGRVVSSHHWPASVGLPDNDQVVGGGAYRIQKVARDYGATDRLTLVGSVPVTWLGGEGTLRGGFFVDGPFLSDLAELMGAEVAFRDAEGDRWIVPDGSVLGRWADPQLAGERATGDTSVERVRLRWAAVPLEGGPWLVVAIPHTLLAEVTGGLQRLTLVAGLLSLVAALVVAWVLSARVARPVRGLAEGARRVAAGDLDARVAVSGDDEVADLARAFNAMTEELQSSRDRLVQAERVAAWREMARRLAHELKNPIFPIQLSIETLRRALDQGTARTEGRPPFENLFRESSETILQELSALRRIVDEFGDFSRMPRPTLVATDVNAVADQVLALHQSRAGAVDVRRELAAGLPPAAADPDLLGRALGNLVGNAFDAMPEGGTLTVRTAAGADGVRIDVADTGPGLTDDQRTRLFTPYYTTKRGGTGLGLAIVQGIVADHGGRVQVESAAGRGTTFTLVLPVFTGIMEPRREAAS